MSVHANDMTTAHNYGFTDFALVKRHCTDEGAIAPKALVNVQNKCQIQPSSVWWIREESSRVSCRFIRLLIFV